MWCSLLQILFLRSGSLDQMVGVCSCILTNLLTICCFLVGLNGINAEVFVLGDLTFEEAVQYYQSLNPLTKDRAYFEKTVFPATGGRMQLISAFVKQERVSGPIKSGWFAY